MGRTIRAGGRWRVRVSRRPSYDLPMRIYSPRWSHGAPDHRRRIMTACA